MSSGERGHVATSVVSELHSYEGSSFSIAFPTSTVDHVGADGNPKKSMGLAKEEIKEYVNTKKVGKKKKKRGKDRSYSNESNLHLVFRLNWFHSQLKVSYALSSFAAI